MCVCVYERERERCPHCSRSIRAFLSPNINGDQETSTVPASSTKLHLLTLHAAPCALKPEPEIRTPKPETRLP